MVGGMYGCVADGEGMKTNGIIRIECNSGKSLSSPPFGPLKLLDQK